MALQTDTNIYVSGRQINSFKSIKLRQNLASHHTLELICRMDVLEDITGELGATSKNFLGEIITIEIAPSISFALYERGLEFKGIVAKVATVKGYTVGSGDYIKITAKSPSYITDDGPNYASHNDVSLSEIIQTSLQDYDTSKLTTLIEPQEDPTLHYSVQHNESSFEYVKRLAFQYGEWFYYNGTELIFGSPSTEELVLKYGVDLKEYELGLEPKSHNYKYYTNDYLTNELQEKDSKEVTGGSTGYNEFVSGKAAEIYAKETKVWHHSYDDPQAKQRLDKSIELQKKAIEIGQVTLTGVSDNTAVKLGGLIVVDSVKYRVVSIEHTNNLEGDYLNNFIAISGSSDAFPLTDINAFPKSETQTAIVKENADPEGIGRIKVQLPWQQESGVTTPWLRIVSPHTGANKGFHFIPEIDEEVLIGFEGGNAESPYVLGSLYTGVAKPEAWKNENNDIKALQTRSGNRVIMNDENGSITIADPSGNVLIMQGNGEIVIQAPNKITMVSKDINILGSNSVNIHALPNDEGGDGTMSIYAQRDIGIEAADEGIGMSANTDITITSKTASANLNAKTDANVIGEGSVNVDGDKINITGGGQIKIESSDTDIL